MADRRGAAIVEAMNAGCTLNDIGTFPGITREGVRSTARKYARRNDLPRPRRPLAPELWVCNECGSMPGRTPGQVGNGQEGYEVRRRLVYVPRVRQGVLADSQYSEHPQPSGLQEHVLHTRVLPRQSLEDAS